MSEAGPCTCDGSAFLISAIFHAQVLAPKVRLCSEWSRTDGLLGS